MRLPRQDGSRRHVFESLSSGFKDWESSGAGHFTLMSEQICCIKSVAIINATSKTIQWHDRNRDFKIKNQSLVQESTAQPDLNVL